MYRGGIWEESRAGREERREEGEEEVEKGVEREGIEEGRKEGQGEEKEGEKGEKKETEGEGVPLGGPGGLGGKQQRQAVLLTTLRTGENKKSGLKRSSSYNTIASGSGGGIEGGEGRERRGEGEEKLGKSFVTAAAMSAFGKSSVLPKTLNKISQSKIFKSEEMQKGEQEGENEVGRKKVFWKQKTDNWKSIGMIGSGGSSISGSSLKSTFATKKERLSAAFVTMREGSTLFEGRRKQEVGEKNTLSLSVSSATNAVRRWGANYITKRHCRGIWIAHASLDSEVLSEYTGRSSSVSFERDKKESLAQEVLEDRLPEYSEVAGESMEPIGVSKQEIGDEVPRLEHSASEPISSMKREENKQHGVKETMSYNTISFKQRPVPLPPVKQKAKQPVLPARQSVRAEQNSQSSEVSSGITLGLASDLALDLTSDSMDASNQANIQKILKKRYEMESRFKKHQFDSNGTAKPEAKLEEDAILDDSFGLDDNIDLDDHFELDESDLKDGFGLCDDIELEETVGSDPTDLEHAFNPEDIDPEEDMSCASIHEQENPSRSATC
ncbi:unnamed protein product [Pneumocystis jirovecii]|uniref:Uncharacterized protein n=1 Tax=Pneumocystis jirovecii TaxID=42068 RepID=L0PCH3_PNEJI|nr:unnamed protein product [Pneumocystis jirovecii]